MLFQRLFQFLFIILCVWCLGNSTTFAAGSDSDVLSCIDGNCIQKPNFTIKVEKFSPAGEFLIGNTGQATVKNVLATLIDKLIIAFWVLALFIMTIGAGYIIIHHGEDEFLSRGKSIFIAGLTSLAVALSAGLIVKFISYLLYQ
jgi:hypothetical protein